MPNDAWMTSTALPTAKADSIEPIAHSAWVWFPDASAWPGMPRSLPTASNLPEPEHKSHRADYTRTGWAWGSGTKEALTDGSPNDPRRRASRPSPTAASAVPGERPESRALV